jgi:hypothetical protein
MAASGDLFPPNPKAGECYARVLIPATFQTTQETMLKREASERIQVIPAEYETITEKLLVKQASTRVEVVPAVYETVTERVLDQPAHTVWKRGPASLHNGSGKILQVAGSQDTGELMCLVEVPATCQASDYQDLRDSSRVQDGKAAYREEAGVDAQSADSCRIRQRNENSEGQRRPPRMALGTLPGQHDQAERYEVAKRFAASWLL